MTLERLRTYVQRPRAVLRCHLSDVYALRALDGGVRDVFLLDGTPCRSVQVVAWVAGVDHREASMSVILDDGDGVHVVPVTVRGSRPDVRPGDVVRVVGRVEEWQRKRGEWVRQVVVEEGTGGSLAVVDDDEQYAHSAQVLLDRQEPFAFPPSSPPPPPLPPLVSSAPASGDEGEDEDDAPLRHPSKLRSSQHTDATFRHYVLDYMTREGPKGTYALSDLFPEYDGEGSFGAFSDLLSVPHLSELARLVVDSEARRSERRRRRREGGEADWRLSETDRQAKMEKLVSWVIRKLAQDGCIVGTDHGHVPLTPSLILTLLCPHMEREAFVRQDTFLRKDDRRRGHGALVDDLVIRMQSWGTAGRWERVREWVVRDALEYGVANSVVRKEGDGYWML